MINKSTLHTADIVQLRAHVDYNVFISPSLLWNPKINKHLKKHIAQTLHTPYVLEVALQSIYLRLLMSCELMGMIKLL